MFCPSFMIMFHNFRQLKLLLLQNAKKMFAFQKLLLGVYLN